MTEGPHIAILQQTHTTKHSSQIGEAHNTLHMVAYALNPKWNMQRLRRITHIQDVEVKAGFMKAIQKIYDSTNDSIIHISGQNLPLLGDILRPR